MTVIARFEVIPVRDGSMSTAIASALQALDRYPVSYETTATDTIIEAESVEQVFAAVQAAHRAIPDDRVITSVEIDEDRRRPQAIHERVASVERELGYPPQRHQHPSGQRAPPQTQDRVPGQSTRGEQYEPPTGRGPSGRPTGRQPTGRPTGRQPSGQPTDARQSSQQIQHQPSGQPTRNRPPEQPPGPRR